LEHALRTTDCSNLPCVARAIEFLLRTLESDDNHQEQDRSEDRDLMRRVAATLQQYQQLTGDLRYLPQVSGLTRLLSKRT